MQTEEEKEIEKHNRSIFKAGGDALKEINQTLSDTNIDIETAEILWTDILPEWCSCEVKPSSSENNILHKRHINSCLWREESEIISFKDEVIEAIKREGINFNNYKNQVIQQIIQKANEQGISETELNNNRPSWQDTLRKLTNREKITEYQTNQLEKDIENLVAAKNKPSQERQQAEDAARENAKKEEERLKKEREEREKKETEEKKRKEQETKKQAEEQAKQQKLNQQKDKSINEIITALNQEPQLTNNELSPQYQNWEEQINGITDIQKIINFQDRILADIQARRKDKKTAEEVKENLKKAQTGTKEEKEQAWENLEKQETEKSYNDNKEEAEKLKKAKAAENPQEYGKEAKEKIEEKLKNNGVKEDELSPENKKEWEKLKNGEIKDPNSLVETETKIKQNIYQKEAEKKLTDLTSRVNKILKLKDKSQIATVKKLLLEFISSGNVYYTSSQKKAAENLLTKLENYSATNNDQNNSSVRPQTSPWKLVIPLLLIVVLVITLLIVAKRVVKKRKRKER